MVINAGSSVDFEANNISGTNVNYAWDFGGASSPSSRRNPRAVQFNNPGTYRVTLQVTGSSNGVPINIFDQRVNTVLGQTSPFPPGAGPLPASSGIQSPPTDTVINVGDSVNFEANRMSGNVNYAWDFGGASSPSSRRNPSPVQFNTPGTFFVTLQVTGSNNGIPVNIYDQRVITVLQQNSPFPPGGNPFAANTGIQSPATDMVINLGDSVNFEANRIAGNVNYFWDFGGASGPSTRRNPSRVQFNTPGTFFVTLQITGDNNGVPVNIYDQRVITVLQQNLPFPPVSNPFPPGFNPTPPGGTPVAAGSAASMSISHPRAA